MRNLGVLVSFLLISSICAPAYVYGDIYGQDLAKVNKTVVDVQGPFTYQLVTDKANYSIFLPEGVYNISASTYDPGGNPALFTQVPVIVGGSDQRVDLVLKPVQFPYTILLTIVVFVIVIVLAVLEDRRRRTIKAEGPRQPVIGPELDPDSLKVLAALDGLEGRSTQKELKESLGFSDAKLSLILTELESIGRIKKFKRGRGNVIRKV